MNNTIFYFRTRSHLRRSIILIVAIGVSFFWISTIESSETIKSIARPETVQRMSGESKEKFELRKQRITYGTPENRKHCRDFMRIHVGLCKGGSESACYNTDLYKAWCVDPSENADAIIAKIPERSREDYFDHRNGRWLSRVEYCLWLSQQSTGRRAYSNQSTYDRYCADVEPISSINADTFTFGGKKISIPAPHGFTRVTQQMDTIYHICQQATTPQTDQLACYIKDSDVPKAMGRGIQKIDQYFVLKVKKDLKNITTSSEDFLKIKQDINRNNKEILKKVELKTPGLIDNMSKRINGEFNTDIRMKVSDIVPFDTHYETQNILAYSTFYNVRVATQKYKVESINSSTVTILNTAGKVLFLYCFGLKEDLDWTRSASRAWANIIIFSNPQPPAKKYKFLEFLFGK